MPKNPLQTIRINFKRVNKNSMFQAIRSALQTENVKVFIDRRLKQLMIAYENDRVVPRIMANLRGAKYKFKGKQRFQVKIYRKRHCII